MVFIADFCKLRTTININGDGNENGGGEGGLERVPRKLVAKNLSIPTQKCRSVEIEIESESINRCHVSYYIHAVFACLCVCE